MNKAVNRIVLDGKLLPEREERRTPSGLPLARLDLEHRSQASIAGLKRTVCCRVTVVVLGEELVRSAADLPTGQWCRVEGLLAQRVRQRSGEKPFYGRLELHAHSLQPLPAPSEEGAGEE